MATQILDILNNNPLLTLFALIGLGLLLGSVQIAGISLGSSGVIFIALIAGHFGLTTPAGTGDIGLALFVYAVGIGAGGRFFGALKREGSQLAKLALVVVLLGAGFTWLLAAIFNLEPALAIGIFAGALTSTPALASAIEGAGTSSDAVVVGYGIAYPFGVAGVVLFIQLLPRLLKRNIDEDGEEPGTEIRVVRQLVEISNPNLFGKPINQSALEDVKGCQIPRISRNGRMEPVQYNDTFEEGQRLLLVGEAKAVKIATEMIGHPSDQKILIDADNERRNLVITNKHLVGQSIQDIDPLKQHGVVITRIGRMEFTFVPDQQTRLEKGDRLTVVGPEDSLEKFESFVGHRAQAFSETSLISMAAGLTLGILLGRIPFPLPGGDTFTLGLAGGPLIVALFLGHFGKVGGIVGFIPRPTRILLQEMGLVFFLADAGIQGGASMVQAVSAQGVQIFFVGAIITALPMLIGFLFASKVLKMPLAQTLGGLCGGMTSTPALGAIVAKTTRQAPIVSYATVYPIAVILMAIIAKFMLQVMP